MKTATMALILLLLAVSGLSAQYADQAAILGLGAGARAVGLGGAFLPLADDETAVFYNPAGLGWIDRISVSSFFSPEYGTLAYGAVGISLPYLGMELLRLDSGWIETDSGGFSYVSQCGVVGVGASVGPVGLGGRLKVYGVESPYTAFGWGFDPAVLINADFVRIGLMWENALSKPVEYSTGGQGEWKPGLDLGVALRLRPSAEVEWSAAFVASGLFSSSVGFAAGIEGWVGGLGIRVGINRTGPSMGLSVRLANTRIDLSYRESGQIGGSYGASLTYSF